MATVNMVNASLFYNAAKTFGLKSFQCVSEVEFESVVEYYVGLTNTSDDVVKMAIAYDLCVGGVSSKRLIGDGGVVVFIPSVEEGAEPYKFQAMDFYKKFFLHGEVHLRQLGPFVKDIIFNFIDDGVKVHGKRVIDNVAALYGADFAKHYIGNAAVKEMKDKLDEVGDIEY